MDASTHLLPTRRDFSGDDLIFYDSRIHDLNAHDGSTYTLVLNFDDGGSITLSSGILTEQPIRQGSSATMVNGAIEGFVRAAAIELDRGLRINAVSPNVVQESMAAYAPYFRGFEAVPAARAALAYSRSVEGAQTGQVYKVF